MAVIATACGGDEATSSATTTSSSAPTTTTSTAPSTTAAPTTTVPELSDEEQIIAVVERFYEVVIEANNPPILNNPLWDEVATPQFADSLRATSEANIADGEGLRYPVPRMPQVVAPSVLHLDSELGVVDFCLRDDTVLYDLASGAALNEEVRFHWKQLTLLRLDSRWFVDSTNSPEEHRNEEECVASYS